MYVPGRVFFTKGTGRQNDEIASFEMALRDAGIAPYNIVEVSSILPPNTEIIEPEMGIRDLRDGEIVHAVLARCSTQSDGTVASALGVARGSGRGIIVERCGEDAGEVGVGAETVAKDLIDDNEYSSFNITIEAEGVSGEVTTAVAAAVFLE